MLDKAKLEEDICIHIFTVSSAMVGVCLTVIGLIRVVITLGKADTVADDLLAVDLRSGSPVVPAAFPQVKLWPESVEALGIEPHRMRTIHPDLEKRALRAAAGFHDDDELPLSRVYVLSDGPEIGAEVLGEQEAFLELVRHSYAASLLRDSKTEHAHFEQCSSLAATGSVRRLTLGGSIERIPELIRAVEEDRGKASVSEPVAV